MLGGASGHQQPWWMLTALVAAAAGAAVFLGGNLLLPTFDQPRLADELEAALCSFMPAVPANSGKPQRRM